MYNKKIKKILSIVLICLMMLNSVMYNIFAENQNSMKRTFDIQEIDYKRSSKSKGKNHESRWEGIAPYAPLFGHMINDKHDTRPLGKEDGDLGKGWGSSSWMTGYLMVDLERFGNLGTEHLKKDEYGLSTIGIVRTDDKYSKTDDFYSWSNDIETAFKEYNGNHGFGKEGFGKSDVNQSTKLVIWDGYKRVQGHNIFTGHEYIKKVKDIDSSNTDNRVKFAEFIAKHVKNGAKLQGYITVDSGLKDIYVPSKIKYKKGEKQIRQVAQIKITDVTYDIILHHVDAPNNAKLPEIMQVKAENKVDLPKIEGYNAKVFDENDKEVKEITADKNMILTVRWEVENIEKDSDGDGLSDYMEDFLKTDKNSKDSDKDGLNDGFEFKYLDTDLLKKDTDGNGISDADEDFDKDGLSNIKEQEVGTNPASVDSDGDNLTDYEEVTKYHTNPLAIDTDKDEIYDDDEIKLGLDPNNPMTDGVTPDAKRMFEQTADDSIKDNELLESNNWLVPSISGNVYDNISKNTRMENSPYSSFKDNRAVLSDTVKIRTSYDIPLNLTFSYKNQYNGDSKNLTIVSFIDNELELVDTVVDEGAKTISGQIQSNGEYFVIDVDEFLKSFGIDVLSNISTVDSTTNTMIDIDVDKISNIKNTANFKNNDETTFVYDNHGNVIKELKKSNNLKNSRVTTPTSLFLKSAINVTTADILSLNTKNKSGVATGKADIVFVVDTTGSMSGAIENVKNNINMFSQKLVDEYNIDANFSLIEFRDIQADGVGSTILHKNNTSPWFTNVGIFKNEIGSLKVDGGGDEKETPIDGLEIARRLNYRTDASKFIVLVTDTAYKVDNSYGIKDMDEMTKLFADDNISVSVISTDQEFGPEDPPGPGPMSKEITLMTLSNEVNPPEHYKNLIEKTDGLFGDIYGDFSEILLKLADKIGKKTNSGDWVILDDYSTVKLSKKLSEIDHNDTDRDGLTDAQELGESVEKNMDEYINLLLKKHSVPKELYKGKRSITVWNYNSNPTELDTDFDGLPDGGIDYDEIPDEVDDKLSQNIRYNSVSNYGFRNVSEDKPDYMKKDIDPKERKYVAVAHWDGTRKTKGLINFELDYRRFFGNNGEYSEDLAVLSSLCAFDIYSSNPEKPEERGKDLNYLGLNTSSLKYPMDFSTKGDTKLFPVNLGLTDIENIKIEGHEYKDDKDDITEFVIGRKKVKYDGKDENVVMIIVRGTNGTHSEWTSNFDVGATTNEYTNATGNHKDWTNKENHKGFDVTANRVIREVEAYLSSKSIKSGAILITGHSRGAAVANLVGKHFQDKGSVGYYDKDKKSYRPFTYAFATPNTTTSSDVRKYKSIFNIVNEDDMIPYMPLQKWGFRKYGNIESRSVKNSYEDKNNRKKGQIRFKWFIGTPYNDNEKKDETLKALEYIANSREELYKYDSSSEGKVVDSEYSLKSYADKRLKELHDELEKEKLLRFSKLSVVDIENKNPDVPTRYAVEIRYCPAFLTQTIANMASGEGPNVGRKLIGKYQKAKWSFIFSSGGLLVVGGMKDPHMPVTYCLIARNIFIEKKNEKEKKN